MHHGPTFPASVLGRAAALTGLAMTLVVIGDPAPGSPAPVASPAKVSSKQGSDAGAAPTKATDVRESFQLPGGGGGSSVPGIDIPPPAGLQQNQKLDPRTRRKLMEEYDRKKNWMFDDKSAANSNSKDRTKTGTAGGRKDSDSKPVEFESSRQRTLLEKRMAGDDDESRAERASKEERDAKNRRKDDPSSATRDDADQDLEVGTKRDRDSKRATATSADRENRPFQQAVFSDPFTAGRSSGAEDTSRSGIAGEAGPRSGSDAGAQRGPSDRVDSYLSNPNSPASSKSDGGLLEEMRASRANHSQQFKDILGGNDASSSKQSLFDSQKSSSASKAFGSPASSGVFGGVNNSTGFGGNAGGVGGGAFSTPAPVRPSAPLVKPQPGVLPFPSKGF